MVHKSSNGALVLLRQARGDLIKAPRAFEDPRSPRKHRMSDADQRGSSQITYP